MPISAPVTWITHLGSYVSVMPITAPFSWVTHSGSPFSQLGSAARSCPGSVAGLLPWLGLVTWPGAYIFVSAYRLGSRPGFPFCPLTLGGKLKVILTGYPQSLTYPYYLHLSTPSSPPPSYGRSTTQCTNY